MNFIYSKNTNTFLRNILKPFSKLLPEKFKFPINGIFQVKGKGFNSFKMVTNPTSFHSRKLFWDNIEGFEFNAIKIFAELIKEANVFFDIGSNIGYYSLLAASINKKNISIFAFEPSPPAFNYLKKNIEINHFNSISAYQLALSNQIGNATFYSIVNPKFEKYDQLTADGGLNYNHSGKRSKINFEVKISTLDEFVKINLGEKKIDLIKLDTEANEHFVLMGSSVVLKQHRPIIQCEILKDQIENEIEKVLDGYDYLYFRVTENGLVAVKNFLFNHTNSFDYYLVPKEKIHFINKFIENQ